jgi:hypothetical protein
MGFRLSNSWTRLPSDLQGRDICLPVAKRRGGGEGHQSETYAVTLSGGVIARKPG